MRGRHGGTGHLRLLFASAGPLLPALGGAQKITRTIAEGLAAGGHEVRAVALARTAMRRGSTREEFLAALGSRGIEVREESGVCAFSLCGVEVRAADGGLRVRDVLNDEVRRFQPDCVVIPSEDWRQMLLEVALSAAPRRVIYHAMTTTSLPVGDEALDPHPRGAALLGRCGGVIAISRYLAGILETKGSVRAATIYPPVFGPGPYGAGAADGLVMMINPSAAKGLAIFLDVARSLPAVRFGVVRSWGTTGPELAAIEACPNLQQLEPTEDMEAVWSRTRVLFVPSIIPEGLGLVAIEAMLRGIPVLASDRGGLPEATLGKGEVLSVAPGRFRAVGGMPTLVDASVQDPAPWRAALERLLSDPHVYAERSAAARDAATAFVASLGLAPYVELFERVASSA